ncbi:DUF1134 domain-containing protein [Siculibacillus lacustris]|uniref:DUF1134 domain-containing protein n=1 Tax=Siculibacillus lacustris TaxID=1549641 RepID=A0A4Q9VQV8_9HYPH|nr:DUF1134 domain-containing protein [Siculibacillus lacustris]TBW37374.1 DUF1134 domain-containing protein [Siculibacillus lacustris]
MRKFVVTKTFGPVLGLVAGLVLSGLLGVAASTLGAAPAAAQNRGGTYSTQELVRTGHQFFGTVSGGLATVIEQAVSRYGQPNGYILGEEGSGAVIGGLRYGEGQINTRDRTPRKVFWQGPSIGWDFGGEGSRTMMLVYNLPSVDALFQRFGGVDGSAYFIGGFGMTALVADRIYVVPVRSGVGLRLGVNLGYLKFTPQATWNPF